MSLSLSAKERAREVVRRADLVEVKKHAKPLKKEKTKYSWKELICWNMKSEWGYRLRAESPTALSLGLIFVFFLLASRVPQDSSTASALFFFFLIMMFFLPVLAEWGQRLVIAQLIHGILIGHFDIRHVESKKTFQIRDVILNWRLVPYSSDSKASSSRARNRAGIEIQFKHPWQIGTPDNPHIFDTLTVFGDAKYLRSLDALAPYHRVETNIFGVEMLVGAYEAHLKVSERTWDETIGRFVASSWATEENGNDMKFSEPFLVVSSKEKQIKDCPHCGMGLTWDEIVASNRLKAKEHKVQAIQATIKAGYEEELKDQTLSRDFKYAEETAYLDDHYSKKWYKNLNMPKWKWWQWLLAIFGIFLLLVFLSPELRLKLATWWKGIGGEG